MAWRDLAQLLLVGGATRMPMIADELKTLTGSSRRRALHPDEAVARGAAHLCRAPAGDARRTPLAAATGDHRHDGPQPGLEWSDPQTGRLENVVLIQRGSELPCGTVAKAVTDARISRRSNCATARRRKPRGGRVHADRAG